MRLIDADGSFTINATDNNDYSLAFGGGIVSCADKFGHIVAEFFADDIPLMDAVPVVRCRDCKHYLIADEFEGGKRYMCEVNHFSYLNSDGDMHFCSYGEPKEGTHADDHD